MLNIVGCSDDTTGPDNSSDPIVAPKQGSTYNYATYDTDATGQKETGTDATYTVTVAATGMTYQGKSNVMMFVQSGSQTDTSYVAYESNGDVSLFLGTQLSDVELGDVNVASNLWLKVPFVSTTTTTLKVVDTTIAGSTGNERIKLTFSATGTGSEEITVGTEKLNARKADLKMDMEMTFSGLPLTSTSTSKMWFIPKIGSMGKTVTTTTASIGGIPGGQTSGSVETLTSYTLQP
jgi:hypothetical protein